MRAVARLVEDDDPEPPAVERGARARRQRALHRIGAVRDEHDGGMRVLAAEVVDEAQRRRLGGRAEPCARRGQQRAHLRVTVRRLLDRVAVDPERDVVQEGAAVHLRHVDAALEPVRERVERAHRVAPVHAEIQREVVASAGRDADEGEPVRPGDGRDEALRPVAAGGAERIGAAGHGLLDQRPQALTRLRADHRDASFARPLHDPGAHGPAAAGPRIDEQDRLARRRRRSPVHRERRVATCTAVMGWRGITRPSVTHDRVSRRHLVYVIRPGPLG